MKFCRLLLLLLPLGGVSSFAVTGHGRLSKRTILARNSQENDDKNSGAKNEDNSSSSSKGGSSSSKKGGSSSGNKPTGKTNSDGTPRRRSSQEGDPLPFASNLGKELPRGGPSGQAPRNVSPPMPRPGGGAPRAGRPPPPSPGASWDPRARLDDNVSATPPGGVEIGPPSDRGFTRIGVPGNSPSQRKRFDFARGVTEDIFQSRNNGPPSNDPRQNAPYPGGGPPRENTDAYPRPDVGDRRRSPENQNYNSNLGNAQDNGNFPNNRSGQRPVIPVDEGAVFNPADAIKGVRIKETNAWSDNSSNFNRGDSMRGAARMPNIPYDRGFDAPYGPGPYGREPYMDPRQGGYNHDPRQGGYNQDPRQGGYNQRPDDYGSRTPKYNAHVDDKYATWPAAKGPRASQIGNAQNNDTQQYGTTDSRSGQGGNNGRDFDAQQQYGAATGSRPQQPGYGQNNDYQQYGARSPQQTGYNRDFDAQRYTNPRQGGYGQPNLYAQQQPYSNGPQRDNYYIGMPPPPPRYNGMYPSGRQDAYSNYNYPPLQQRFGYDNRYYGYPEPMGYGGGRGGFQQYGGRGAFDGFWQPDTYRSDLGAPGSYSSWRAPLSPDDKDSRKAPWEWSS